MIHLIYLYFIINAMIAGYSISNKDGFVYILFGFLFGLPFFTIAILYSLITGIPGYIEKTLWLKAWYRLYFTDYYKYVDEMFITIRSQQYRGIRKNNRENFNWYQKLFMRKLDKKYNHDITR